MKTTLHLRALIAIFFSFLSMGLALAQVNPVTGLPMNGAMTFDPTTGQPIQPGADWKDSDWKDPNITVTNVAFDGVPVSDVASYLREQFHNEFDIVLPRNWGSVQSTGAQAAPGSPDWNAMPVSLQLKNVSASEIFNTMNLAFENDRVPLRWELKLNGNRRIALLRVLADPTIRAGGAAAQSIRRIYYVGNLIDDEKNGGMTMKQIIKTVTDVWEMGDAAGGKIQFHMDAQLLVVTGDSAQVDFVEQTLKALGQKVDQKRIELAHPEKYGTNSNASVDKK